MSSQVVVEVAGQSNETIALGENDAVLVGREPEVGRILALADEPPVRAVTVSQPNISANHLLIRRDAGITSLTDIGSRNGSWLRLPPGDRVEVRSTTSLQVRLPSPPSRPGAQDGPREATWVHRGDFHAGVVSSVRAWFDELSLRVRISIARNDDAPCDERMVGRVARLPLANGFRLEVVPTRTVDTSWDDTLAVLWRYVSSQNAIFTAEEETRDEGLILASPAIRRAHRQIVTAAQRGLRLLLIGPSGAGKDGLARCYHRYSRRGGAFVAKDCSTLSHERLRAELFGTEQGAFTTAVRRIVGAIEACHGGTLFLDEIGGMSSEIQPFLLRFLDRGEYERMGGDGTVRSADVRLVCATNKDLRAATVRGELREDLWYRIASQVVHVPPLRDRPEDIEAFLRMQVLEDGGDQWSALDPGTQHLILTHDWAGNFRELTMFSMRLPHDAKPGSLRAEACRELLHEVALAPRAHPPSRATAGPREPPAVSQLAGEAVQHFVADHGHDLRRWDDVKECLERYLKPLLFAEMSGASSLARREDAVIPTLAGALDADRGTVIKHLNRYFERFQK
jgi:DNA-binding NtrC family response regulator